MEETRIDVKLGCKLVEGGVFTDEGVRKYLRMAWKVEEMENPCLSQKIGTVIADPQTGHPVSWGHNGPPDGSPRCDSREYLDRVVWPQLTEDEKKHALYDIYDSAADLKETFLLKFTNCGQCPRRVIGAPSGRRLELCVCSHSEAMAVVQAHRSVAGCWLFCHCGVPCVECSKVIVAGGIKVVVGIDHGGPDYSPHSSRYVLERAGVDLRLYKDGWIWQDG